MAEHPKEETKDSGAPKAPVVPVAPGATDDKKKNTFTAVSKTKGRIGKTEDYADDRELYEPRLSAEARREYWQQLLQNKNQLIPPAEFDSWVNQNSVEQKLLENFHPRLVKMVQFITSAKWDFIYIYGLMLWTLLVAAIVDGFIPSSLGYTYQSPIAMLPIVVSLLSQIIPSMGSVLLVHRCNDLVKILAQFTFTEWSFVSVLLSQYIEFFYYGGQGKEDQAGQVTGMKDIGVISILRVFLFGCRYIPPQIHPEFQFNVTDGAAEPSLEGISLEGSNEFEDNDKKGSDEEDSDEDSDEDEEESKTVTAPQDVLPISAVVASTAASVKSNALTEASSTTTKTKAKSADGEQKTGAEDEDSNDGEEIGYLAQIRRQERRRLAEEKRQKRIEQEKREKDCTDWKEWVCVVCGRPNRRPSVNPVDYHINFGTKGVYYKRHYAQLKPSSTKPTCTHCYTPSDYKTQLATSHLFVNNPRKHQAFQDYPKTTRFHPGLKTDKYFVMINKYLIILFGIKDDPKSKIVYNDWRLPKLLALQFPTVPRFLKPPEEYYCVGEFLECKYQKVDWSRCQIKTVHGNHSYDIKFNTGDEIRFVYEKHLRLPPEKRNYAYRVELGMAIMYILFPVCLLGAVVVSPGIILLPPLIVSAILIAMRSVAALKHYRLGKNAGVCVVLRLWLFFTLPMWMMIFAALMGLGANYSGAVVCVILGLLSSLPVLYSMRPTWAIFGALMFIPLIIGLILILTFIGKGINYITFGMVCIFLSLCVLHHVRSSMSGLWDVQMKIRVLNAEPEPELESPSMISDLELGQKSLEGENEVEEEEE